MPPQSLVAVAYPTTNLAIYVPVRLKSRVIIKRLFADVVAASGNVDLGIYDAAGVRLVSSGSITAVAPTISDITDLTVGPGLVYLAINSDNTTITLLWHVTTAPIPAALGVLSEALGSVTLPSTASWATAQGLGIFPNLAAMFETTA
jgi:hypothetical protein